MKVLVCLPSYGLYHRSYLEVLLKEYESMTSEDFKIHLHLYITEPIDISNYNLNITVHNCKDDPEVISNPISLCMKHKYLVLAERYNYDLYIESDDDVLISYENIKSFLEQCTTLPVNLVPGHVRYEIDSSGLLKLIDSPIMLFRGRGRNESRMFDITNGHIINIIDDDYFERSNPCSACYVLTKNQLNVAIDSGNYFDTSFVTMGESSHTIVYVNCNLIKVTSRKHMRDMLCRHLEQKYCVGIDFQFTPDTYISFIDKVYQIDKYRKEIDTMIKIVI